MSAARGLVVVGAIAVVFGTASFGIAAGSAAPAGDLGARRAVAERLDAMPLLFVPEGMGPDGPTAFVARGREGSVWLGETGLAYRLHPAAGAASPEGADSWVVALDLVGASPRRPVGEGPLPTRVSYFTGPKEQWRTGLPSYGSVVWREPWPGINLVVSGAAGELKSTFVVRPGADPDRIRLAYRGATAVRLGPDGGLVAQTPLGDIREQAPVAYQDIDGRRVEVAAAFELEDDAATGRRGYRFRLGDYDPAHDLVVDPVTLVYCGYIGGDGKDYGRAIAVDGAGSAYVTGIAASTETTFPVTVGPGLSHNGGLCDVFVAKVNPQGTGLEYCGYIGGSDAEEAYAIAVDGDGNAYVTGETRSDQTTFPVVTGPDLTINGGEFGDAFVAKVNAAGTALEYCGYLGGSGQEQGLGIAVDDTGRAYVAGSTSSTEASFPVVGGPDLTHNGSTDAFVARVNPSGTALEYCGYIGGSDRDEANGVAVGSQGDVYVTGSTRSTEATFPLVVGPDLTFNGGNSDAFVAKVNATGTALEYCGYIGGSEGDGAYGIAVDPAGSAYVAGWAGSDESTFPVAVGPDLTHNGGDDGFVAKLSPSGAELAYCGYIGGSDSDAPRGIAVDAQGTAYVAGTTSSTEATFPVLDGPDLTYNGGYGDAFVARVNADGAGLGHCGYVGGSDRDSLQGMAVDAEGNTYIVGYTRSTEGTFPVTVGPDPTHNGDWDAFIAKVPVPEPVVVEEQVAFLPAAASAAGAAGAFFQTDVEVNNRGDEAAEVVFRWLPRGLNNAEPLESEPVALPPGRSLRFDNVLDALFGLEPDAVGALALVADRPDVLAMSRTYNLPTGKAGGTFGQGLPAIPEAEMLTGTGRSRLIFLSEDADARANVGCVNGTAERTVVTLEVFDAAGTPLQTRTVSLPPYSNTQINRVLGAWQPVDGYVDVSADRDDARYYCYGSMLDNLTSDPTTILPQSPSDPLTFVPAAALAAGLEGAFFQTDLDLNNAGASPLSYELRWLPRGADGSDAVRGGPFTLAPGAGVRYANVLAEVFGLAPDQVGGLAVEASGPELLAMSRTYNVPPAKTAGTFGQELPGVPADRLLATGERRRILFMNENDDVRSNVGCQNGGLAAATVKLELYSSEGVRLGARTMELPPRSNNQITRIFRTYAPITAGYVDLWTDTPGAAVYCYGSVLDNLTSDPTTVLPQ